MYYNTTDNWLYFRNEADTIWIRLLYVDQSSSRVALLDDAQVVNTSGTQTGLIGDQATATWEAGTGTTESLVSPAKVKAAILALGDVDVGAGTAALAVGSIGTYALLKYNSGSPPVLEAGDTTFGSNLRYAGAISNNSAAQSGPRAGALGTPSGTWRVMGRLAMSLDFKTENATLYLRIA
tara:strand:+ start:1312 stop:1851 length:540 start_codon:yes stop_codon:yes gene_type:complete